MSIERELTRNRKVDVALENERVTRERVAAVERQIVHVGDRVNVHGAALMVLRRGFWGRLNWLVRGK